MCCPKCCGALLDNGREFICKNCGIEVPIVDDIPRFWDTTTAPKIPFETHLFRNPAHWTGWRKRNFQFFLKELRELPESSMLLDVGAGTTPFIQLIDPFKSFKVDFLPYAGIDFLTDLNRGLPLRDASFDTLIMSNLLEHISEPLIALKECKRVLKNDGRLIMSVPFLIKVHQAPYDFLRYTEFMLERLLFESGFKEVIIEKIGNIFDVEMQVSGSLYKYVSSPTVTQKGAARIINAFLYRLHYYSIKGITRLSIKDKTALEDSIGYPHGYGCVAVRRGE